MAQSVLVTGGAGYLGSLLVPRLLAEGHRVTVYDRLMWGIGPLLPIISHPDLTVVQADIRDEGRLKPHVTKADVIINLAAIVGYPACQKEPTASWETNLDAVAAITKMSCRTQLFIHASTGSTYGAVDDICTEETPINPLTIYGRTKAEAEPYVLDAGGVPLRFATVFGASPRMRLDLLINDIVFQVVHFKTFVMYEGHARRTFLHSTDAVRSILFAMDNYVAMSGKVFNIGEESLNYTKSEIAEIIRLNHDYYLHRAEFGEDLDKRDYAVSYKKIKSLGFQAQVSLEQGVHELLKVCPLIKEPSNYRNA